MSNLGLGPGREFDRLRGILARLGNAARDIGDDCALIPDGPGRLVVSVDLAVEEIHFRRDWLTLEEIGWRAASAALSDLAAEGAEVVAVLTGVAVPSAATDEDLYALMAGIGAAAVAAGGVVSGGDLSAGERWVVNLTVIGRARRPVTRGGAMVGDGIWVTGALGGARAALEEWRAGRVPVAAGQSGVCPSHPPDRRRCRTGGGWRPRDARPERRPGWRRRASRRGLWRRDWRSIWICCRSIRRCRTWSRRPLLRQRCLRLSGERTTNCSLRFPQGSRTRMPPASRGLVGLPLTRIGQVRQGSGARFTLAGKSIALRGYDHFA